MLKYLKIKLTPDSEPIENPNYLDCKTPEEMVTTQLVLEALNIDYDRCGIKEDEKAVIRYFTDTNLDSYARTEIKKMKTMLLDKLKKQHGDRFINFISPAIKAFDAVQLCEV